MLPIYRNINEQYTQSDTSAIKIFFDAGVILRLHFPLPKTCTDTHHLGKNTALPSPHFLQFTGRIVSHIFLLLLTFLCGICNRKAVFFQMSRSQPEGHDCIEKRYFAPLVPQTFKIHVQQLIPPLRLP